MFKNNVKTFVLLTALGALFMGVGSFFGQGGLIIGLVLGLVFVGGSYWFSDKIAVQAAGAKPVSEHDAPQLYAIVRDLDRSAPTCRCPRSTSRPASQPNAFATGRNEHHAAVAVTQGLLQVVDEDELRGVLAHEISHVRNRDILIGSVAAAVALGITFLARMAMWGALFGGGGQRQRRRQHLRRLADGDPRPDRGGAPADGALAFARVRGRPQRRRAARHRRAAGLGAPEDRGLRQAGADGHRPGPRLAVHHQPAHGSEDASSRTSSRPHPPTEERIARLRSYSRNA